MYCVIKHHYDSVNFKQLILLVAQRSLQSLHNRKDLFFFQSSADHLHPDRQPMHGFRVVQFVRALCHSVQFLDAEIRCQRVKGPVDMRDWYNPRGVVKLPPPQVLAVVKNNAYI